MTARQSSRRLPPGRTLTYGGFDLYIGPDTTVPRQILPWIAQLCDLPEYSWYVAVDRDWAGDWFNQYGVNGHFDDFDDAIDLICDKRSSGKWLSLKDGQVIAIHQQALRIYGMLHARWICLPRGMVLMKEKYEAGVFGECPRVACNGAKVLPMGTTLIVRRHSAKLFCPICCDLYRAPVALTFDGAHFGPAFPHMFLFEYQQFDRSAEFRRTEMRAFGFRIHRPDERERRPHDTNKQENENLD
jgi:casein kinase II subunit beta